MIQYIHYISIFMVKFAFSFGGVSEQCRKHSHFGKKNKCEQLELRTSVDSGQTLQKCCKCNPLQRPGSTFNGR